MSTEDMVAHNTEIHWQIPADCHMIAAVAGNFARASHTRSKGWCKPPISWLKLETDFPVLSYALCQVCQNPYSVNHAEGWDMLGHTFQIFPKPCLLQSQFKLQRRAKICQDHIFSRDVGCNGDQWSKLGGFEGLDAVGSLDVVDFWNNTAAS